MKLFARLFTARSLVNLVFATRMCTPQLQTPAGGLRKHRCPQYVNSLTYNSRSFTVSLSFTLSLCYAHVLIAWKSLWSSEGRANSLNCPVSLPAIGLLRPLLRNWFRLLGEGRWEGGLLALGEGGACFRGWGWILPLKGRLPHWAGARHKCFSGWLIQLHSQHQR